MATENMPASIDRKARNFKAYSGKKKGRQRTTGGLSERR